MTEPKNAKARYQTIHWAAYNGCAQSPREPDDLAGPREAVVRPRQRIFSDAAIQFCLSIKGLFGLALRQSLGLIESLLRLAGLDWRVPDFSTVSQRQKSLQVHQPYRAKSSVLDLPVDSTGIKFLGEGEWKRKKHGAEYRRQWRKVHLGIDADTLEIRAIEVTDKRVGDAPMLPELLNEIAPDQALASVSGDGAYGTKACHAAIVRRGAQAVIPPAQECPTVEDHAGGRVGTQRGAQGVSQAGAQPLEEVERLPRRRNLVETKMHGFKRLGERVMARTFERQVVELHVRVALLNRFSQLGRPTTVPVAAMA